MRRTRYRTDDELREIIKDFLLSNYLDLWDSNALYMYTEARSMKEEYMAIKTQAQAYIHTGNVTERFSRGLLRALDVYEQQFGVSDIGMTETIINV